MQCHLLSGIQTLPSDILSLICVKKNQFNTLIKYKNCLNLFLRFYTFTSSCQRMNKATQEQAAQEAGSMVMAFIQCSQDSSAQISPAVRKFHRSKMVVLLWNKLKIMFVLSMADVHFPIQPRPIFLYMSTSQGGFLSYNYITANAYIHQICTTK